MRKEFPDPSISPQDLDQFLKKHYHLRLYPFAYSLANCLTKKPQLGLDPKFKLPDSMDYRDLKKEILNLQKKIRTIEKRSLQIIYFGKPHFRGYLDFKKAMLDFLGLLDEQISFLEKRISSKNRGAPMKTRYRVTLAWASYVRERRKEIDWRMLQYLLDWFWERLRSFPVYEELRPIVRRSPERIVAYMKNLYYKHKKTGAKLINDRKFRESILGRLRWDKRVFEKASKKENWNQDSRMAQMRVLDFTVAGVCHFSIKEFLYYVSKRMDGEDNEETFKKDSVIRIQDAPFFGGLYIDLLPRLWHGDKWLWLPKIIFPDFTFLP